MSTLAFRLRQIRLSNRATQESVALIGGVEKEEVQKYENSDAYPNSTFLLKVAVHFGVGIDYFFRPLNSKVANIEFRVIDCQYPPL